MASTQHFKAKCNSPYFGRLNSFLVVLYLVEISLTSSSQLDLEISIWSWSKSHVLTVHTTSTNPNLSQRGSFCFALCRDGCMAWLKISNKNATLNNLVILTPFWSCHTLLDSARWYLLSSLWNKKKNQLVKIGCLYGPSRYMDSGWVTTLVNLIPSGFLHLSLHHGLPGKSMFLPLAPSWQPFLGKQGPIGKGC